MYKVYITDTIFENMEPETEILAEIGAEVISLNCTNAAELKEKAKDADALLNTYLPGIDGYIMDSMKNLKVIVRYGIGINTIDIGAATKRGIQVANVPDYCLHEVSDHAVALALDLVRKITMSNTRIKKNQDYSLAYLKPIRGMQRAIVTIIGFGRIGKLIATKLAGFGCSIHFYDPFLEKDYCNDGLLVRKSNFNETIENSDIIIIQAPSTKDNYHMLDAKAFSRMKKKPYIINTARGELIDRKALVEALKQGSISGAALDVVENMPPVKADDELLRFDNVILTPHSAWFSENALTQLQRLAAAEVLRALKGEWVRSLINPEVKKVGLVI
ncbi:MAG: C-terminal binding protein [Eubacteriales bacterium]|nr:C-terminal binding protein [Eubacteriales bacterium]